MTDVDRILNSLDGLRDDLIDVRERLARLEAQGTAPAPSSARSVATGGAVGAAVATLAQFFVQKFGGG